MTSTLNLGVDSPYKLVPAGFIDLGLAFQPQTPCSKLPSGGSDGYNSVIQYIAVSFFGTTITNNYINEDFSNAMDDYIGNNWLPIASGLPYLIPTTGTVLDNVCSAGATGVYTPPSLPPQSPLLSNKIDHATQAWFVGSQLYGSGMQVQSDTIQRYQDHGRHLSIVSPVR